MGDALVLVGVGGAGVVAGIDGGGTGDGGEVGTVCLDVGMASSGDSLHEAVVVEDVSGGAVAGGGGGEQQPECVASRQSCGEQSPVWETSSGMLVTALPESDQSPDPSTFVACTCTS